MNVSDFRPLADRVLVRPDKAADKIGRIILPDSAKKPTDRGLVLAVGPGMPLKDGKRWPMPVEPGQRVIYHLEGAQKIKLGDEMLLLMRDDFVIAVEEPDAPAS